MRIVSLLPSATEIAFALGLGDDVVGVTDECDFPPEARDRRIVSRSALPPGLTDAAEIDALVSASVGDGDPVYRLDEDAFRELDPELVLTQDLCAVCAVPTGLVDDALARLQCHAMVLSMDPGSLDEVLESIVDVGRATGTLERAHEAVSQLRARLERVRVATAGLDRPRVFALEWADPPFNGGHWVPEMIELAGGEPVLAEHGRPSVRMEWDAIGAAAPDVVVFMPCGYDLEGAAREAAPLFAQSAIGDAALFVVDANASFSRPGPRLVDGVEMLAEILHPATGAGRTGGWRRLR